MKGWIRWSSRSSSLGCSMKAVKLERRSMFNKCNGHSQKFYNGSVSRLVKKKYRLLCSTSFHAVNWEFPYFNIQWRPVWISPTKTLLIPLLWLNELSTGLCRINKYFTMLTANTLYIKRLKLDLSITNIGSFSSLNGPWPYISVPI